MSVLLVLVGTLEPIMIGNFNSNRTVFDPLVSKNCAEALKVGTECWASLLILFA